MVGAPSAATTSDDPLVSGSGIRSYLSRLSSSVSGLATRYAKVLRQVTSTLVGKAEITSGQVAEQAGVSPGQLHRFWQALGFPQPPRNKRLFTSTDVEILRTGRRILEEGGDPEELLQITRVTGQALARMADAHIAPDAEKIETVMRCTETSQRAAAEAISEISASLTSNFEPFLAYAWRRHLLASVSRLAAAGAEELGVQDGGTVGFADLVDFTAISRQLSDRELGHMVTRFQQLAYDHVPDRGGRIVKIVGDEIMFSTSDTTAAAEIALALAEACHEDSQVPEVRIGMATGAMLAWEGDLYGPTVNLASRLVEVARPGTAVVSDELCEKLRAVPAFALRKLRRVKLKGVGKTRVWALQRPKAAS